MFDKVMQAALIADGEKLAALTGEDHGPWDIANDGPFYGVEATPIVAEQQGGDLWRVARPVYHMPMPVTADGQGPACPEETVRVIHEVWDQVCRTLCTCNCAEDARLIAEAVNAYRAP